MSDIAISKTKTNFDVIFKSTFKNVYTRVSTYVAYLVFFVITSVMLVLIPALIPMGSNSNTGIVNVLPRIMQPFFYVSTLILAISSSLIAANVLQLNETTFELSRPISRKTFMLSKSSVALIANSVMWAWYIIGFIVCQEITASKFTPHLYIFSSKDVHLNYATIIVPSLLAMLFATFMTFALRPYIIKKDGIISVIIVLFIFASYQIYTIVENAQGKEDELWYSTLLIPGVIFFSGAICTIITTIFIYKNLYIKV